MPKKQKLLARIESELLLDEHARSLLVKKIKHRKVVILSLVGVISVFIAILITSLLWYNNQLLPVDSTSGSTKTVVIEKGLGPLEISQKLKNEKLIRSTVAFDIYTRINGSRNNLQAGSYKISQKSSLAEIIDQLTGGKVVTFNITFYPGDTLSGHIKQLAKAGYSSGEIETALRNYDTSLALFDTKPSGTDLEGYIHGETYKFAQGTSVDEILTETFKHYSDNIQQFDLVKQYANQGLTLFEGITLASIVQKEVFGSKNADPTDDQKKVAQVFLSRLNSGMTLGSDVTYQYIADKLGIERSPNLDNPYNTRKYTGLPPGPIATPSLSALRAVASPADTDYLFFLSGDDDITYFARTNYEHLQNISNHCKVKCSIY